MLRIKEPFNNYVDKMRVGEGQKMSVFVHTQGVKTFHAGLGGGSKNGKILSTYIVVKMPLQPYFVHISF